MAEIFQKTVSVKDPVHVHTAVISTVTVDNPDAYRLSIGYYQIVLSQAEKKKIVAEWALMEKINQQWLEQGNTAEVTDAYLEFALHEHNK